MLDLMPTCYDDEEDDADIGGGNSPLVNPEVQPFRASPRRMHWGWPSRKASLRSSLTGIALLSSCASPRCRSAGLPVPGEPLAQPPVCAIKFSRVSISADAVGKPLPAPTPSPTHGTLYWSWPWVPPVVVVIEYTTTSSRAQWRQQP
jgi:hypothetical protein